MQQLPRAELQWTGMFLGTSLYSRYHPLPKGNTDTGEVSWDTALGKSVTFVWHTFWFVSRPQIFISFLSPSSNSSPVASFTLPQTTLVSVLLQGCEGFGGLAKEPLHAVPAAVGRRWSALLESWRPDDVASKIAGFHITNTACLAGLPPVLARSARQEAGGFAQCGHGITLTNLQLVVSPANAAPCARTPNRN